MKRAGVRQSGWRKAAKSTVDRVVAAALLVVLLPIVALVALSIRVTMGAPVIFRQRRGGLDGRPVEIFKFRTMRGSGSPATDAQRITRLGRLLRKTGLDEIPQLVNVLRGDISLVGPRPLLYDYVDRYTPAQARRHEVLPGITGWAQVNGRNATTWEERFELDVWYVDHWSLGLDLAILGRTFRALLQPSNAAHPGHATMPEFFGSKREEGNDGGG